MTPIQKQFFALVQSGLWGTDTDVNLFDEQTDWKTLYQFAKAQALLGITFDGVQTLPPDKRPKRGLYLQWCNALLQIVENNGILNRELVNVYTLYRTSHIEPVLLKGQGVAQNYRNPLHRQCGDIDLYIGSQHYELANKLLRQEATDEHEENYKHTSMEWHSVQIENHRILTSLNSPSANRSFQREIAHWHNTPLCRNLYIEEYRVSVPPLEFDAVYLIVHALQHFLNEGIGLRQVCDWASLLHANKAHIDREEVAKLFRKLGLTKAAKAFGVVVVNYLGLPTDELPVPFTNKDLKNGDQLLRHIWQGGNFGRFDKEREQRPKGYWSGKWHTFTRICKRCCELGGIAPSEASWQPFMVAAHSAQAQWKRLRKTYKI